MLQQEYISDLNEAITMLEEHHPDIKRNLDVALYEYTKKQALEARDFSKENLFIQIARIYALINDAHTSIRDNDLDKLKVKFLYEDNRLYIINHKYKANFLFEEVIKINGLNVQDVINQFNELLPKENDEQISCNIETMFVNLSFLRGLKIVDKEYVIETTSGKYNLLELDTCENWIVNIVYNESRWLDSDNYYFKYGLCGPDRDSVEKLIDKSILDIEKSVPKRLIIDLRGNVGGNSLLIKPFVNYLKVYLSKNKVKLICLVDKKVFSSGIFAAMDFKRLGARVIGEKTSGTINHFGYPKRQRLKNSNYNISVSQVEWIYNHGEYESIKNYDNYDSININKANIRQQVSPEIQAVNNINDLKVNKDKVLEISTKI